MQKARLIPGLLASGTLAGLLAWKNQVPPPPASDVPPAQGLVAATPETGPRPAAASTEASSRPLRQARECLALAGRDPLAAMELALRENLCANDPGLLPSIFLRLAGCDFAAAQEWAERQEAGDWRDDLLARLAYLRAQTDPLAAARIAVTDLAPGPRRDEAILSVVHQWALRDPEGAALWAGSMPEGALRRRALAEVEGVRRPHG